VITFRQRLKPFKSWFGAWVLFPVAIVLFLSMVLLMVIRWQTLHGSLALAVIEQKNGTVGSGRSGLFTVQARYVKPQQGVIVTTLRMARATYQQLALGATIPVRYLPGRPEWALPDSESTFDWTLAMFLGVSLIMISNGYNWWKAWRHRRPDGYLPNP
jgi:hypothetical protein